MNKFKNVEKILKFNFQQQIKELSATIIKSKSSFIMNNRIYSDSITRINHSKVSNSINSSIKKNGFSTKNKTNSRELNTQANSKSEFQSTSNNENEKNHQTQSCSSNSENINNKNNESKKSTENCNTYNTNNTYANLNNQNNQESNFNDSSKSTSISSSISAEAQNKNISESNESNKISEQIKHSDKSPNLILQATAANKAELLSDLKFPIEREALKQTTMKKLNEHIPLETINDAVLREMLKHRVFEDSVAETVEKVSKNVPEITAHEEFRRFIQEAIENNLQEELKNKEGLIILKKKNDPLVKYGMDYHHYRNYADRLYQVDIREVLEKDLFEKQRVIDSYVEENRHKINEITGYYENKIKFTKFNKFSYLVYQNNYLSKMNKIRISFLKQIGFTAVVSFVLALSAHPLFCLLLVPEYISILYAMFVLNRTVDQIILAENKQSVKIRSFNFLGLRKEIPGAAYEISRIRYLNKFDNNVLNLSDKGFSFATRLLWRVLKPFFKSSSAINDASASDYTGYSEDIGKEAKSSRAEKKKNIYNSNIENENLKRNMNNDNDMKNNNNNCNNKTNFKNDTNESKTKNKKVILDNFQLFHMITANGDIFYLPADLSQQHIDTNEELLLEILNNNYKKILEFDYSEYEDRSKQFYEMVEDWKKEYAKKSHEEYFTKEEKLQKEYMMFIGNRDYAEKNTQVTLKRADGLDGTFIDNGYR